MDGTEDNSRRADSNPHINREGETNAPGPAKCHSIDRMRRRGKQKGHLQRIGRCWAASWWEDVSVGPGVYRWKKRKRAICDAAKSKKEAQEIFDDLVLNQLHFRTRYPESLATLSQFWEDKFAPLYLNSLKPSGRIFYTSIWTNHVKPFIGHMPLRDVTYEIVQGLIEQERVRERPRNPAKKDGEGMAYSPQTLLHIKNVLSAMFRTARRMKWYAGDLPTEGVEIGEIIHKERRTLSPEQVLALVGALQSPFRELILFFSITGVRAGEAFGQRWKYVNLHLEGWAIADGIAIPPCAMAVKWSWTHGQYRSVKSSAGIRIVPLPKLLVDALTNWKQNSKFSDPESPVFPSKCGTPLDYHNLGKRLLKPVGKRLGMPWISWHCFRHTANTFAAIAGLTVTQRKRLLGWTPDSMALHYEHFDVEHARASLEKVGDLLAKGLGR